MPQGLLPFFPNGVAQISDALAFKKEEGKVVYFNYQMPIFIHDEGDEKTFRMITSQFCVNGNAKQSEIVRAFGVTPISVKRGVKKYRDGGAAAFYVPLKGRGPSKLTTEVMSHAQDLLDQGKSANEVASTLNLKANTIRKTIAEGRLYQHAKKKKPTTPAQEADAASMMQRHQWAWAPPIRSNES